TLSRAGCDGATRAAAEGRDPAAERDERLPSAVQALLALDELPVAGRLLEGGETGGSRGPRAALRPVPLGGGERGRRADEDAEHKRAQPSRAVLLAVHESIVGVLICTLGDLLLDVIVRPEAAPAADGDTPAVIRAPPGGQADHVAA